MSRKYFSPGWSHSALLMPASFHLGNARHTIPLPPETGFEPSLKFLVTPLHRRGAAGRVSAASFFADNTRWSIAPESLDMAGTNVQQLYVLAHHHPHLGNSIMKHLTARYMSRLHGGEDVQFRVLGNCSRTRKEMAPAGMQTLQQGGEEGSHSTAVRFIFTSSTPTRRPTFCTSEESSNNGM